VGVVLRRVNRILFELATLSVFSVSAVTSDSQAKTQIEGEKHHIINSFYDGSEATARNSFTSESKIWR
jgi:hypothetical protein